MGGSNIIESKDTLYINDLAEIENEILPEEVLFNYKIGSEKTLIIKSKAGIYEELAEAVLFTDALAKNYAHWLTEVLPKINIYISRIDNSKETTLLLDKNLAENIYESVKVLTENHNVTLVESGAEVRVRKCFVISPTGYVPYGYRDWSKNRHHGYFNQNAMTYLRGEILKKIKIKKIKRKIYIKRNSSYRILLNEEEVMSYLSTIGYDIIEPEMYSFQEQVALFNSADEIMGPTGAGMANIMFTKSECKIFILISDCSQHAYEYWPRIAAVSGNIIRYIKGTKPTNDYIHGNYRINIEKIKESLN